MLREYQDIVIMEPRDEIRLVLPKVYLHETYYGTFHSRPDSETNWTIYDTRGTFDGGPACSHCDKCECYHCYEIHKNDPNRPCASGEHTSCQCPIEPEDCRGLSYALSCLDDSNVYCPACQYRLFDVIVEPCNCE